MPCAHEHGCLQTVYAGHLFSICANAFNISAFSAQIRGQRAIVFILGHPSALVVTCPLTSVTREVTVC